MGLNHKMHRFNAWLNYVISYRYLRFKFRGVRNKLNHVKFRKQGNKRLNFQACHLRQLLELNQLPLLVEVKQNSGVYRRDSELRLLLVQEYNFTKVG